MKNIRHLLTVGFTCATLIASANGIVVGDALAAQIASAIGAHQLECSSSTDKVTLEKDSAGKLRMIATYSGSISGKLDTDNEGGGEECGGLGVKYSKKYADYILDDTYDDCERGNWGYRLLLDKAQIDALRVGRSFGAKAVATDDATTDGAYRSLSCELR